MMEAIQPSQHEQDVCLEQMRTDDSLHIKLSITGIIYIRWKKCRVGSVLGIMICDAIGGQGMMCCGELG